MVVLTGANGFIGRRVLSLLADEGREVVTVTRQPLDISCRPSGTAAIKPVVAIDGDYVHLLPAGPFTLVHCAWCKPDRSVWAPHAAQGADIAQVLEKAGDRLERVVAVGSAEEYGDRSGCLVEEQAPAARLSPYGWGKSAAALLLRTWSQKTKRPSLWLRPFTVYGEEQSGDMVLPYTLRSLAAGSVARLSDGRQWRDFIHVADVAGAIVRAIEAGPEGHTALNVGTGVATPLSDVLRRLAGFFGRESLLELGALPRRVGEPELQFADASRIKRELGWEAKIGLDDGLRRLYESQRK